MINSFPEILNWTLLNINAWEKSQLQSITVMLGEQTAYAGLAQISNVWDLELCINVGVPCIVIEKKMMNSWDENRFL